MMAADHTSPEFLGNLALPSFPGVYAADIEQSIGRSHQDPMDPINANKKERIYCIHVPIPDDVIKHTASLFTYTRKKCGRVYVYEFTKQDSWAGRRSSTLGRQPRMTCIKLELADGQVQYSICTKPPMRGSPCQTMYYTCTCIPWRQL